MLPDESMMKSMFDACMAGVSSGFRAGVGRVSCRPDELLITLLSIEDEQLVAIASAAVKISIVHCFFAIAFRKFTFTKWSVSNRSN